MKPTYALIDAYKFLLMLIIIVYSLLLYYCLYAYSTFSMMYCVTAFQKTAIFCLTTRSSKT